MQREDAERIRSDHETHGNGERPDIKHSQNPHPLKDSINSATKEEEEEEEEEISNLSQFIYRRRYTYVHNSLFLSYMI